MSSGAFKSIAIAGAWGYIGRKFLDAARSLGLHCAVYDPGPAPDDLPPDAVQRLDSAEDFLRQRADLFHLALHPEDRRWALQGLLSRGRSESACILCEKPMASPDRPEDCQQVLSAVGQSQAVVLYDFPELYDPITRRIAAVLTGGKQVSIDSIYLQRSKDREDPAKPRNYKRMVHIQYQESVHCLAFALYLLALVRGGYEAVFADGFAIEARTEPYLAPNPCDYQTVPDGKVEYAARLGATTIVGRTDFKRGAPEAKLRIVRGSVDGEPLYIEADYQEGRKRLIINGRHYAELTQTNSYAEVIRTIERWRAELPPGELMGGLYPNPTFAHITYRLSTALFLASRSAELLRIASLDELLGLRSSASSTTHTSGSG